MGTYSSQCFTAYPKCKDHISFLQAITSCNAASAFFNRGKEKVFKLLEKCQYIID